MRLALLTSARGWGGATLSYARVALGLSARGHEVLLLARSRDTAGRFAALGITAAAAPRAVGGWRRLRRFAPDAILADQPRDLRIGCLAGLRRPAVVYRYNRAEPRPGPDPAGRLLARRVAACVFQSRYAARVAALREPWVCRRPWTLVPNGFDLERFAPDPDAGRCFRRQHGIAANAILAVTLAELTRDKGHRDAIAALGRVRGHGPVPVYLAAGDGPLERELRRRAEAGGIQLLVTGWLEGDALTGALNAADLVLHPSLHEIFPNAVGEAMACGRPVVATDVGGTPELVGRDGGAGALVPPGDPDALGAAIAALVADPGRRVALGTAARRRVAAEFPLARMVDGIESALRAAAAAR